MKFAANGQYRNLKMDDDDARWKMEETFTKHTFCFTTWWQMFKDLSIMVPCIVELEVQRGYQDYQDHKAHSAEWYDILSSTVHVPLDQANKVEIYKVSQRS